MYLFVSECVCVCMCVCIARYKCEFAMRLTCVPLIIIMASTVIMNLVCHVKIK